ncbi:MAG: DUF1622 domain-containing protein [Candidatus Babeliales bacterium]
MELTMFDLFLSYTRQSISMIGVLVIIFGACRSLYQLFLLIFWQKFDTNYIRLQFGDSVILGLEFMVGADIVGSLIDPDYYNLGLLAILVLIRTILSYFLNLELAAVKLSR